MISSTSETVYPLSKNPSTCCRVSEENVVTAGNAAPSTASLSLESSDALISVRVEWNDLDVDEHLDASVCEPLSVAVVADNNFESTNSDEGNESFAERAVVRGLFVHTVYSWSRAVTWAVSFPKHRSGRQRSETQSQEKERVEEDCVQEK